MLSATLAHDSAAAMVQVHPFVTDKSTHHTAVGGTVPPLVRDSVGFRYSSTGFAPMSNELVEKGSD
jgi:hypothetical protein